MSRSVPVSLAITLLLAGLSAADLPAQEAREFVNPGNASDPASGPYSGAVLVGNTLYLAGKIGLTADNKVPETAAEEARLVLDDLQKTLQSAGMSMNDLVSVQVFCSALSITPSSTRSIAVTSTGSFRHGHSSALARCCSEPDSRCRASL